MRRPGVAMGGSPLPGMARTLDPGRAAIVPGGPIGSGPAAIRFPRPAPGACAEAAR